MCPSYAPYNGVDQSIACVSDYSDGSGNPITSWAYKVNGLPAGSWTAYPGYCTEYGCATNAEAGTPVTLVAGRTAKANLTTPFLIPGEGLLLASVTVTGAPAGFDDQVAVTACPTGTTDECQTFYVDEGIEGVVPPDQVDSVTVLLTAGSWTVSGMVPGRPLRQRGAGPEPDCQRDRRGYHHRAAHRSLPSAGHGRRLHQGDGASRSHQDSRLHGARPVPPRRRTTGSRSPPSAPVSIRAQPDPGSAAVSS